MTSTVTGLNCPRCGGIVPVPEGQVIVACPYCDQRSVVSVADEPAPPAPQPEALPTIPNEPPFSGEADLFAQVGPRLSPTPLSNENSAAGPSLPGPGGEVARRGADPIDRSSRFERRGADPIDRSPRFERRGVLRYQVPLRITRDAAVEAFRRFVSGKFQVARDCARTAQVSEVFLVHLPFWAVWGRGMAYAFGQQQVGSGDNKRYEPREKRVVRELTWNAPACEVGEFGVRQVSLDNCPLDPFDAASLHRTGMVFEPVGSAQAALQTAEKDFQAAIESDTSLSRVSQRFVRLVRPRLGLVYYPLWVVRYLYHGRAFQVVVDGLHGEVLYGKAPGSVAYRASVLVAGMAAGSALTVDAPVLLLANADSDSDGILFAALIAFAAGLALLWTAYRTFRHAEHYEYHRFGKGKSTGSSFPINLPGSLGGDALKEVQGVIRMVEKIQ